MNLCHGGLPVSGIRHLHTVARRLNSESHVWQVFGKRMQKSAGACRNGVGKLNGNNLGTLANG